MKMNSVVAAALAASASFAGLPALAEEGPWADLFARDFSNCEVEDGAWKFDAEGCLVPLRDRPIFTKASLSHYELEVVYAMGPKGNSGCLIYDTEHPRAKIEVQMQDDADPAYAATVEPHQISGSLYGHQAAFRRVAKRAGEWNTLRIFASGQRVRVVLNGVETANADLSLFVSDRINPDGSKAPYYMFGQLPLAEIPTEGRVGFQGSHAGGEASVRIRSAKIRPLRVCGTDPSALERAAAADYARPVRPAGVDGQAFWNGHSEWFRYPPSFDFKPVAGAAKYRFAFVLDGHQRFHWDSAQPTDCLAPTWDKVPENGMVTVFCHALGADGRVIGLAGERTFWKTPRFRPSALPLADRTPAEAAAKVYDYLFELPSAKHFLAHGKPDPAYGLNCYPAKMHASTIGTMVRYARLRPDRRDAALKLARTAADYLISVSQPAGAPLEYMPPTYEGKAYTASAYAGQQMMLYPALAADAYLSLHEATKEAKYFEAAKRIAETYLKLQGADGTCFLKLREKDGSSVNPNRMFPIGTCRFLERLYALTGDRRYRDAADRGFAYVEKGPLRDWNWEGQFEDVEPTEKYVNLTKHPACETAIYMLERFPGDKRRIAQAREILRWSEDQFIAWSRPCRPDGTGFRSTGARPGHFIGGAWDFGYGEWACPSVMEQYRCYVPIDASAAKLVNTFMALYRAERNPLDLAKAQALAATAIRVQEPSGRIATFWTAGGFKDPNGDWINCMAAIARALENLE